LAVISTGLSAQDARQIVTRSVELDQTNWQRLKDYTWIVHSTERHFGSSGKMKSEDRSAWETLVLDGEPYRRMLQRNNRQLSASEQRKEQEKLDKSAGRLARETPQQKQQRLAEFEKRRRKERAFIREIPDAYELRMVREDKVDGLDVWVIAGTPKPGYQPKDRDARVFNRIRGEIWIDKSTYQWVRVEARTIDTISFGLVLARLNPGARLVFEQVHAADGLWLPKRLYMQGGGRVALLKRIAMDQELTWSDYRKFQVDTRVLPVQ